MCEFDDRNCRQMSPQHCRFSQLCFESFCAGYHQHALSRNDDGRVHDDAHAPGSIRAVEISESEAAISDNLRRRGWAARKTATG
jgi:hypothetical protein